VQWRACSAAALQGQSVFIFDSNAYYGGAGATLNLSGFMDWYGRHAAAEERRQQSTGRAAETAAPSPPPPPPQPEARKDTAEPAQVSDPHSCVCSASLPAAEDGQAAFAAVDVDAKEQLDQDAEAAAWQAVPLTLSDDGVRHIEAHVEPSRVPGRDNEYCIDLSHQVRPEAAIGC
jgi:hypothetical protein